MHEVATVQNRETSSKYLLYTVREGKGHQLEKLVLLEVLLHVSHNLLLKGFDSQVVKYFPGFKNLAAKTPKSPSIKAFYSLLEIIFLNKSVITLKSSTTLTTFE